MKTLTITLLLLLMHGPARSEVIQRNSYLIILKEQSRTETADLLVDRESRLQHLYLSRTQLAIRTQRPFVRQFRDLGLPFRQFYLLNAIQVDQVPEAVLTELKSHPMVKRIIPNTASRWLQLPLTIESDEPPRAGANIQAINADRVWSELGVRGEGIVVAGQDTGVDWTHPALTTQYRGRAANGRVDHRYNWYDAIRKPLQTASNRCGYALNEPCDDGDHGTHTLGTAVGGADAQHQIGVAPGAKWIACRNMDQGYGTPATYLACFEFFLAPFAPGESGLTKGQPELAPHVINNSWGCPSSEGCLGPELHDVLKVFKAAGIMVVASAGNDGPRCGTMNAPPAYHSAETLSVGAIDHRTSRIASFSSRGPSTFDRSLGPDLVAPGVSIVSAVPGGGYEGSGWSGTSMAGPHLAGAIALLWSAKPNLKGQIDRTVEVLQRTATPLRSNENCGGVPGQNVPNNTYGFGLVNILQAIRSVVSSPQ